MEPVTIAIICAVAFGATLALTAFIRQLILSRDKLLNDRAQQTALKQEAKELENIRNEMKNNQRFDSHYQVLGSNKDAIQYLDHKVEEILQKKSDLIERYAQVTIKESSAIIDGEQSASRKLICDKLKTEIDSELRYYEIELENLQKRRASMWDTHQDLQDYLLEQEEKRNTSLDTIYTRHSSLLEKIYLRHNHNSENVARSSIEAGTSTFKAMAMAPIMFLMQLFSPSTGITPEQAQKEMESRDDVIDAEKDINDEVDKDDDVYDDGDLSESENPSLVSDEEDSELSVY